MSIMKRNVPKPIFVTTRGDVTSVEPANGRIFDAEELQQYVGGYFEHPYRKLRDGRVCVCNEEGRISNLGINMTASDFYGRIIYGNVLICDISFLTAPSNDKH